MKGLRAKRILSFIFSRFLLRTQYVVKFVSESLTNSIWVFSESVSTNLRLFQKYEALSTYQWRNRQNFPRMNQAPVEFLRSTCRQMHECTIHHSCYVVVIQRRDQNEITPPFSLHARQRTWKVVFPLLFRNITFFPSKVHIFMHNEELLLMLSFTGF